MSYLSEFDDPEREQRVEDIVDDWVTHCHGVQNKVIGLMAVHMDTQAQVVKRLSAEGAIMRKALEDILAMRRDEDNLNCAKGEADVALTAVSILQSKNDV